MLLIRFNHILRFHNSKIRESPLDENPLEFTLQQKQENIDVEKKT